MVMECPSAKRSKPDYKICGHWIEFEDIYKEHKRLYYNAVNKSWVEDTSDVQGDDQSSSELSSIDDLDPSIDSSSENAINATEAEHPHSDGSDDFLWEEPLGTPEDIDKGTSCRYISYKFHV